MTSCALLLVKTKTISLLTCPLKDIVMLLGVRSLKTKPKFLAADTNASSSGD